MNLLLAHGADPRWRDADGNTLLAYLRVDTGTADMIRTLVKSGLPLNAKNKYGATILNYATEGFLFESQGALLRELGAKAGKPDDRLRLVCQGISTPAARRDYQIQLKNGSRITGRTDVFGMTSWTPDTDEYTVTLDTKL